MHGQNHIKNRYTFMITSRSVLLRMRIVSDKSCRENQNTHFVFNIYIYFFENRAFFEIMWENTVMPDRPQMTVWRMRIACWIPKAKNTHSLYAIHIAVPLQQCSHERASLLRHTHIACRVFITETKCVY